MSEIMKKALTDKDSRTSDGMRETAFDTKAAAAPWN
jgi:hypothetical protein